jgi:hypothetical protein
MSRCKACNNVLKDHEMLSKNKHGQHEEHCRFCINAAFDRGELPVAHLPDPLLDTIAALGHHGRSRALSDES